LLPQHSGPIEIQAPVLSAAVPETRQRGGRSGGPPSGSPFGPGESPFERFFGRDPFADMDGLIQRARPIQVRGPTLTLDVKPQPAGAPSPWLPAEDLHLAEIWTPDPAQARVGEPITRTLAITAQGLSATQLPDLTSAVPAGVKLYPDKPRTETRAEGDTLVAVKEIKQALVPAVAGKLILPEVRLAWWDTRENKEKVAVLPERILEVQAASGHVGDPPKADRAAPASAPSKAPASLSSSSAPPAHTEARVAEIPSMLAVQQAATAWPLPAGYWPWLGLGLGLVWLLTLLLWWLERRRFPRAGPVPELVGERPSANLAAAMESVREACDSGDPRAARTALLAWGQACWRDDPPKRIETLADRLAACHGAGVGEAASSLRLLDQSLYAPGVMSWDGPAAWRYLQPVLGVVAKEARSVRTAADPLPVLYPKSG
nr:BatD family protein [Chromatiaceae bacterium]